MPPGGFVGLGAIQCFGSRCARNRTLNEHPRENPTSIAQHERHISRGDLEFTSAGVR